MIRFLLAALCAAAPTVLVAQAPATQAAAADADRLAAALETLKAGDAAKAVELTNDIEKSLRLTKAKPTDPTLVNCLHVRGVAQYRLGQHRAAADSLQRTAMLASANRSLVVNLAISDLRDLALLPRSVKNLQVYASANPTDEEVVNLWGSAMAKLMDGNKIGDAKAKEWEGAYLGVKAQLERTRPGKYRWGSEWIDHQEHSRIEGERQMAQGRVNNARSSVRNAEGSVRDAQADLARARAISVSGRSGAEMAREREYRDREIARATARVEAAKAQLAEANANVARAAEGFPKPLWVIAEQMVDPIPVR